MIMKMTHLEAVVGQKTVAKSGVALQTEFSMLNTRLGDKADSLERLEHKIWDLFQLWTGVQADETFVIQYKKKFDLRDENNDLANYQTVRAMGIQSETLDKELSKQIAMIVVKNGDIIEDIVDEIDNAKPLETPKIPFIATWTEPLLNECVGDKSGILNSHPSAVGVAAPYPNF